MNLTTRFSCNISLFSNFISKRHSSLRLLSDVAFQKNWGKMCVVNKKKLYFSCFIRNKSTHNKDLDSLPFQSKKRLLKKKKVPVKDREGFRLCAFSTAEEYLLENLLSSLPKLTSFVPTSFNFEFGNLTDAVHAVDGSGEESERKHLFFFREGSVVMWNVPEAEAVKILDFVKLFEENSFREDIIKNESEEMTYSVSPDVDKTGIVGDRVIFSANAADMVLEKYAVSNAMSLSVHLGTFEASLQQYIDTMEPVTEDLKAGVKIKMSRGEVLRKTGQLFALRHNINLSSDLLDTPDFYWDREDLEKLYQSMFNYFCVNKRTKVMNEKINHCIELVELLSSHLNDKHHVRLEWMIIVLIMIEVAFEILHYYERYGSAFES